MAEYQDLGPRAGNGFADPTNPIAAGNWTVKFPPSVINVTVPVFEIYHIAIQGPGGFMWVYRDTNFWDAVSLGTQNGWDPAQPMLARPTDSIYLYWSTAQGSAPAATIWLRYSPSL